MENRNDLVAQPCLTHATNTAERDAALVLVDRLGTRPSRITLEADKGCDVLGFIQTLRQRRVTPHIDTDRRASKTGGGAALGRGRPHYTPPGLHGQPEVEKMFAWVKSSAGLRQTKHRGQERVGSCFDLVTTAYNGVRLPKLLPPAA